MTTTTLYTSSTILDKICKIAANKFDCNFDDVGMVVPDKKRVFNKRDDEAKADAKSVMCFHVFSHSLENIGTVTRSEARNYANGKSDN